MAKIALQRIRASLVHRLDLLLVESILSARYGQAEYASDSDQKSANSKESKT